MSESKLRLLGSRAEVSTYRDEINPYEKCMKIEFYGSKGPDGRINLELEQNPSRKQIDSTAEYLLRMFGEGSNLILTRPDSDNVTYKKIHNAFRKKFKKYGG